MLPYFTLEEKFSCVFGQLLMIQYILLRADMLGERDMMDFLRWVTTKCKIYVGDVSNHLCFNILHLVPHFHGPSLPHLRESHQGVLCIF